MAEQAVQKAWTRAACMAGAAAGVLAALVLALVYWYFLRERGDGLDPMFQAF